MAVDTACTAIAARALRRVYFTTLLRRPRWSGYHGKGQATCWAASALSSSPSTSSRLCLWRHVSTDAAVPRHALPFSSSPPHAKTTPQSAPVATPDDPLLAFLKHHHEDGAVLLAMWTSLYRSCLYASEVTEALALRVRYAFHVLLRHRAVAAAVALYERLQHIGVSLRQSDLVLLLSSLPYDHSAARGDARTTLQTAQGWIEEAVAQEQSRDAQERRRVARLAAEAETRARHAAASSKAPVPTSCATRGGPTWVRNWVLYELSMGNLELDDEPTTDDVRVEQDGEALASATHTAHAARQMCVLDAVLEHLRVLQQRPPTTPNVRRRRRGGRRRVSRRRRTWRAVDGDERDGVCRRALRLCHLHVRRRRTDGDCGAGERVLTESAARVLHDLVRASSSPTVPVVYARVVQHEARAFNADDAVLFFRRTAATRPWTRESRTERLVSDELLPLIQPDRAAGLAVQALWLSHLCLVKAAHAEHFFLAVQHVETLWGLTLRRGDVATLVRHAVAKAELAASHLHVEVRRWDVARRDAATVAPSVRSGRYVDPDTVLVPLPDVATSSTTTLLPTTLMDVLVLCAEAVLDALTVATAAVPHLGADGPSALELPRALLENAVLGPRSVWGVFAAVYLGPENAKGRQAPERTELALTVAHWLLRVVLQLCRWDANARRQAGTGVTATQVRQVLEYAVDALRGCTPGPDAREVAAVVVRLAAPLLRFLRLYDAIDERGVFGALRPDVMASVGLYGRLLVAVDDLTGAVRTRSTDAVRVRVQRRRRRRLAHRVVDRLTLPCRRALRTCFDPNHRLGRHVRAYLDRRALQRLDAALWRRAGQRARTMAWCVDDVLDVALTMRRELYAALLRRPGGDVDAVARRLASGGAWREGCVLAHLLRHDLRPAPHTVSVDTFAAVMAAMGRGLPSRDALDATHRSLWVEAMGVFWYAVDHTATPACAGTSHTRAVLAACLLSLCELSTAVGRRDVGQGWRAAWVAMYTAAERRELQWGMLHVRALTALRDRAALSTCVRLYTRLPPSPTTPREAVGQLLCEVAVRHADWRRALEVLQEGFGDMEQHARRSTRYGVATVHTMLTLLARSRTNLSNTALRLRTVQGDAWDAESAVTLAALLLRARRWRLALEQVRVGLRLPELCVEAARYDARCDKVVPTPVTLQYAKLLVCGLQACAIGSQGSEAEVLYDAFKAVLHHHCGGVAGETDAVHGARITDAPTRSAAERMESGMDALLCTADAHSLGGDDAAQPLRRQLRELAPRARGFFFRAMTKKMK